MKNLMLILALVLTTGLHAATSLTSQNSQLLQNRNDTSTREIFQGVFLTDSAGNPIGLSFTVSAGGLSITASPVLQNTSRSAEVWLTQTASVKSLTTTVGSANARCIFCVAPSFGGAGVRVAWGPSLTAPTDLYGIGVPIATSASAQCFGPFAAGINAYIQGSGAASVTGALMVDEVK